MKKVLIIHPALAPYRVDLFNFLAKKCDLQVIFLCHNVAEQKFDRAQLESRLYCSFRYLVKGFNLRHHLFRFGLNQIINDFDPDVVITSEFNVQTIQFGLLKKYTSKRFKLVTLTDDSPEIAMADGWKRRWLKPFVLKMLDGVLVCSDTVKHIYRDMFAISEDKMAICPVLQDAESLREKIAAGHDAAMSFFQRYELGGKKVVLFIGRQVEVKNLPFLLRGFAAVADTDARLVLVGEGPLREELMALADNLGCGEKVIFAGRYDGVELYAWYLLGQLLVLPSTFEPFGAVVNEALAAGVPCLVSSIAGAAIMLNTADSGEVFNPDDFDGFRQCLGVRLAAIAPLRKEDVKLHTSLQRYSLDEVTDKLADFFQKVTV